MEGDNKTAVCGRCLWPSDMHGGSEMSQATVLRGDLKDLMNLSDSFFLGEEMGFGPS